MNYRKRVKHVFVALATLALVITACSKGGDSGTNAASGQGGNKSKAPIKLGLMVNTTGPQKNVGQVSKVGLEIAVEDINGAGGINGFPIDVVIVDDANKPEQGPILARKLALEEKAVAAFGPWMSGVAETAFPVANELGMPMITYAASKDGIVASHRPWIFRNRLPSGEILPGLIEIFKDIYPEAKTFAIAVDMKDATSKNTGTKLVGPALRAAGYEVANESDPIALETGATDFSAQVTKLKSLKVDAVAIAMLFSESAAFAREMQRQGVTAKALITASASVPEFLEQGGPAVEGFVLQAPSYIDEKHPKAQDFIKRYEAKWPGQQANPSAGALYDAVIITADILRKDNVTPDTPLEEARKVVRDGWANLKDYQGLTGKFSMGSDGEVVKAPAALVVKNGRFETVVSGKKK